MGDTDESMELARRATAGDSEAFHALLERFGGRLLDRIRLLMGPQARQAADSSDFLQGTFLEALKSYGGGDRLRDERSFLRWLTVIARNNIHDAVRRRRERAFDSFSTAIFQAGGKDRGAGPSSQAELDDQVHLLVESLQRLDEDHRRAIELRALEGLSFREVARNLGRSEDAARMLYHRSLTRLGEFLDRAAG